MSIFTTTEHFNLHTLLSKLVTLEKLSKEDMEILLSKAGLHLVKDHIYLDETGSQLNMKKLKHY
jgi:hypothetical protein